MLRLIPSTALFAHLVLSLEAQYVMSSQDTVPADFMGSKSRPRRFLLSTALLSAITVVALVAWLYVFRHGPQNSPSPSSAFTLSDPEKGNVTAKPDTDATATAGSNSNSSLPATALMPASEPGVSSAPIVKLRQGTYIGATIPSSDSYPKAIEAFRGIPFAETTAGESRFRLPVPIGPSDGTFNAVALGQSCPGSNATNATGEVTVEGEDCLNLNVYRPRGARPADRRLPVVVYVHGGGFNGGVGTERNMASFVSWAKEPIIAVNFNYRVGALGFLPSAVTAREGLLNLGLKDQQLLFAWVRDNVAAFGGDADNITLMGLSAGAHSVGARNSIDVLARCLFMLCPFAPIYSFVATVHCIGQSNFNPDRPPLDVLLQVFHSCALRQGHPRVRCNDRPICPLPNSSAPPEAVPRIPHRCRNRRCSGARYLPHTSRAACGDYYEGLARHLGPVQRNCLLAVPARY